MTRSMHAVFVIELVAASLLASVIVQLVRQTAYRREWLDRPNDRSSHQHPTPRGGGLAIVVVTIAGAVVLLTSSNELTREWIIVLVASAVVAVVSWIDDVRSLPNKIRFAVHLGTAAVAVAVVGPIARMDLPGLLTIRTAWLAIPLTILWIAGLTNVYNFMDGIDGIAGIQAVVAGASWVAIGLMMNDRAVVVTAALMAASSLGFLIHNWSPATIFMGDVGSAFIGYLFAVFAIRGSDDPGIAFAAALAVWPFLFDTTFTLIRRLRRGENITKAHNTHLYQRLVRCGWSHGVVAATYGALAVLGGLFAVAVLRAVPGWQAVYAAIPLAAAWLWLVVLRAERVRQQTTLRATAAAGSK